MTEQLENQETENIEGIEPIEKFTLNMKQFNSQNPHPVDILVGKNLKKYRRRCGIKIEDMAEYLGISHVQLAKYENAQNRVSASMMFVMCEYYEITVNRLFIEL